jgi:hypothetical protein
MRRNNMSNGQDTVRLVSAGLGLGIKAYEAALRLSAAGYDVPGLSEFQQHAAQLKFLAELPEGGSNGSPLSVVGHS